MKTKNRRVLIVALALAALLVAGGYFLVQGMDRNLTRIGRRITTLNGPLMPEGLVIIGSLSEERLLAYGTDSKKALSVYTIDTRSSAKTTLPNLDAAFKTIQPPPIPAELSPDGQWLSCDQLPDGFGPQLNCAVRIDGSQVVRWKTNVDLIPGQSIWCADSKGGESFNYSTGQVWQWRLADPILRPVAGADLHTEIDFKFHPIGAVAGGYIFYRRPTPNTFEFMHMSDDGDQRVIGTTELPNDAISMSVSLSPNRLRLLWIVTFTNAPPQSAWLRIANTLRHIQPGSFDGLWTSGIDGSNLHEVGFVRTDKPNLLMPLLRAGWMQDGARIWFEHNESVWIVPAGG